MYYPNVSVFAPIEIKSLSADVILSGLAQRLELLTYLFCPDEETDPKEILDNIQIETTDAQELKLRWRPRMRYPTRVYKFENELSEQIKMRKFGLESYTSNAAAKAKPMLESWVDGVGFTQSFTRDDMGWPVVMAAASAIAEKFEGVIVTNGYGWFVPSSNEVQLIIDPDND